MKNQKKEEGFAAELTVRTAGNEPYDILIRESFADLPAALEGLGCEGRRICIVTDSNVTPLYLEEIRGLAAPCCAHTETHIFEAGEEHKTLDAIRGLYAKLIEAGFDRRDFLIALGGGVIGDMTGFAAATFLRGIRFIQIPTTLLAQIDSSIGGKTGVDFDQYKNMVGAFHQPSLVYTNVSTLKTLSDEQFASGMGESLKHGLIRDAAFYEWTLDHMGEIEERETQTLLELVSRNCQIKRYIVEKDPLEKGDRALLNFGHTLGHALEKCLNFRMLHGECVAIGFVAAAYISWQRGLIEEEEFYEIRDMNVGFGLPISFDGVSSEEIVKAAARDKKMDAGKVKFILLKKLGKACIDTTVTEQEMLEALRLLNADERE